MLQITTRDDLKTWEQKPMPWEGDVKIGVRNSTDLPEHSHIKDCLCLVMYSSFMPLEGPEKGIVYEMKPGKQSQYFWRVSYAYVAFAESGAVSSRYPASL